MKKQTLFTMILAVLMTSQFQAQNLQERIEKSDLIIEGKVVNKESYWNLEKTRIYTKSSIEIYKIFKGIVADETIQLITFGGIVEEDFQIIPHSFQTGIEDEGIFFMQRDKSEKDTYKSNELAHPFIAYSINDGSFEASDGFVTYQNPREIYTAIESEAGHSRKRVKNNTIETKAENWINQNFAVTVTDTIIEFSFENIEVIGSEEVEFDVMVKSNQEGIKFAASDVFLNYSTDAFGESVVANERVAASKETVIENAVYTLDLTDQAIDIVRLVVSSQSQPAEFYPLSLVKEKFIHVIIDIENIFELASIEFDDILMGDQSFFYDETTGEYLSFDRVHVDEPILPFLIPQIEWIAPNPVPAGTRDDLHILNIHGNDFEDHNNVDGTFDLTCNECKVRFRNGDASGGNWVYAVGTDIISWTNTDIFLRIPSTTLAGGGWTRPAASGAIRVEGPNGISTEDVDIHIPYSVLNIQTGNNPVSVANRFAMSRQTVDGIEFVYNEDVPGELRNIFRDAADTWCNQTNIAWSIAGNTTNSDAFLGTDNMNIVSMQPDDEFPGAARAAVVITGHYLPCNVGGIAVYYIRDVDVILRETSFMPFEDNLYERWYNRILHELGHAHLLYHSINPSIPQNEEYIMFADLTNFTDVIMPIQNDDAFGAQELFVSSADLLNGCADAMPIFMGANCDGVNAIKDLPNHLIDISVFPNPINEEKFTTKIELEASAKIQLKVVNLLGQELLEKDLGLLSIGEHSLSVSLPKEAPPGNYFVKFYIDEELVTLKLIRI